MAESEKTPFKEFINRAVIRRLAEELRVANPGFPHAPFERAANCGLDGLELKNRVRHVAAALRAHLPREFPRAVGQISEAVGPPLAGAEEVTAGFHYWPYLQFIEDYGGGYFEESMDAIHELTQRFSAEFAIRPFLAADAGRTLARIKPWLEDESLHVRRLCSEGTRPLLPWGLRLKEFQADPKKTAFILEALRDDKEVYVRRSVANHLNDHAKAHPKYVVGVAKRWRKGRSPERQWMVRHALRTLVKRGDPAALSLLGYAAAAVRVDKCEVEPARVKIGEPVTITLELSSADGKAHALLIDYAVHYRGANGQPRPKVFKWKETQLPPEGTLALSKKQYFKPVSIRTLYQGEQGIEILINGTSVARRTITLSE